MNDITIKGCIFTNHSSIIHNLYLYKASEEIDFQRIEQELEDIKKTLGKGTSEYGVVETLEKCSKAGNVDAIGLSLKTFGIQFSNAVLSSLAGNYLSHLFGL